ncbi:hypothetical protein UlMin_031546 [Ulmus minor]
MEKTTIYFEDDLNLEATELRLGLPGCEVEKIREGPSRTNKRASPETEEDCGPKSKCSRSEDAGSCERTQVVGWPPIRSYRKNNTQSIKKIEKPNVEVAGVFVKVSVDGAPYLRKIDLRVYKSYPELLKNLENMFKLTIGNYSEREGYNGSEFAPTYEDKDGDWMLVGDVPWEMFVSSCKRMRIMKASEARGLTSL